MKRRLLLASIATALLPAGRSPLGQLKSARIGMLTAQRAASLATYVEALRAGLAEFGWEEGRNLVIEHRYAEDDVGRVPTLAEELVRLPVHLIVSQGAAVSLLARLMLPVPVVYVVSGDPVSAGLADSLARPRGNMTGVSLMAAEVNGKRLEMLHEIISDLKRVAIIGNPGHPGEQLERANFEEMGTPPLDRRHLLQDAQFGRTRRRVRRYARAAAAGDVSLSGRVRDAGARPHY